MTTASDVLTESVGTTVPKTVASVSGVSLSTTPEQRLQEVLANLERLEDSSARETAQQCVATLLEFYGVGLSRIMQRIGNAGETGAAICDALV